MSADALDTTAAEIPQAATAEVCAVAPALILQVYFFVFLKLIRCWN